MAILIIEQHGQRHAGTLNGRVLIGRWPDNTVVIEDKSVSRIHAWIGLQDERYYIADGGSRTGTFVNGRALHERHPLEEGDEIRIGPAILKYSADDVLPAEATEINLAPRLPNELSAEHGVFMDCVCGAPLWLPREFVGKGKCRYCGHTVTQGMEQPPVPVEPAQSAEPSPPAAIAPPPVPATTLVVKPDGDVDDNADTVINFILAKPKPTAPATRRAAPPSPTAKAIAAATRRVPPPAPTAKPTARRPGPVIPAVPPVARPAVPPGASISKPKPAVSAPAAKTPPVAKAEPEAVCGICHSPITVFDEVKTCPSCGLGFHGDCWKENHGCSAYGCAQVGAVGRES